MNEKWYAVYTRPRWEKRVAGALTEREITNFCPLNKVTKQWSDRRKIVYEPLFTSYVFLQVQEKQFGSLKKIDGILSIVHWLGRPAVIREEEIETIKVFLNAYSNVYLESTTAFLNNPAQTPARLLVDKEGVSLVSKRDNPAVTLPSLGVTLLAEAPKKKTETRDFTTSSP